MIVSRSICTDPHIEIRQDGGPTRLVGYAAVFDSPSNDLGGFVEVIRPGAFKASLREEPDVSARIQHEGGLMTIGRTTNGSLRLREDRRGLWYEVEPPDTSAGRDILELVKRGFIDRSSFAFTLRDEGDRWDFNQDPAFRELLAVNLHDVAPVDGPAYESTTVTARGLTRPPAEPGRINEAFRVRLERLRAVSDGAVTGA